MGPAEKELLTRIEERLAGVPHRFEIQDPFSDTIFRFQQAHEVLLRAEKDGVSRFQSLDSENNILQVIKREAGWTREDGKSLREVQAEIDEECSTFIKVRSKQRALVGRAVESEVDRQMALADAYDFRRIQDPGLQESAAVQMAENARVYPGYKTALDVVLPGYPGTAKKVYTLDAAFFNRITAKKAVKSVEVGTIAQEVEARAKKWTPDEAAEQARQDWQDFETSTDQYGRMYMSDDMKAKAEASQNYEEDVVFKPGHGVEAEKKRIVGDVGHKGADIRSETNNSRASGVDRSFVVMAPYWLDGIHNVQGIALADSLNKLVKRDAIGDNEDAIAKLVAAHLEEARRFGLAVVSKQRYLDDPAFKNNPAQPRFLKCGFVRDKNGDYRPLKGGNVALSDKGDSLVLKSKDKEGYAAAIELAKAKGWQSIELSGKPKMIAGAWLQAKLQGLDVVNYSPSKEDIAKLSQLLGEQKRAEVVPSVDKPFPAQSVEKVDVRPFVDADGHNRVASVVYTVTGMDGFRQDFDKARDAAGAFVAMTADVQPSVIRSVTRADGEFESSDIIAQTICPPNGKPCKTPTSVVDREFDIAVNEAIEAEKIKFAEKTGPAVERVKSGSYNGVIVSIKDGLVYQKVDRYGKIVCHDRDAFDTLPEEGDVVDIKYNKNGVLELKRRDLSKEFGMELSR